MTGKIGNPRAIEPDSDDPADQAITAMMAAFDAAPVADWQSVLVSFILNALLSTTDPAALWAEMSEEITAKLPEAMLEDAMTNVAGAIRH